MTTSTTEKFSDRIFISKLGDGTFSVAGLVSLVGGICRGDHPDLGTADAIGILDALEDQIQLIKDINRLRELIA